MAGKGKEGGLRDSRRFGQWPDLGAQLLAALALLTLVTLTPACSGLNFSSLKFWQRSPKTYGQLELRPTGGDATRMLQNAHYLSLMGRRELALKELEEAFRLAPQNPRVANALARGYEEAGAYDKAQQVYRQALAQGAHSLALYNNYCYSYFLAGNFKKAEACFRQALEQNPQNAAARNNLGLLLCRTGRAEEARRLWQEAEGQAAAEKRVQEVQAFLRAPGIGSPAAAAQVAAAAPAMAPEKAVQAAPRQEARPPAAPVEVSAPVKIPPPEAAPQAAAPVSPGPAPAPERTAQPGPAAAPAPPPAPKVAPAQRKEPAPRTVAGSAGPQTEARPTRERPLTAVELTGTGIRVENGNGYPSLAHDYREILGEEGFNVVSIGNFIDFGQEETVIYCRAEAARLARVLGEKFFATANVCINENLPPGIGVRVIMGHDLLLKEDLLEKLAG
jgi:Flp pilus assembly protein TadD